MKNKRIPITVGVLIAVVAGCSGDQPTLDGGDGASAIPVETIAPSPIEATRTGDDGAESIAADDGTSMIRASYDFSFADDLVLPTNDTGFVFRANAPVDSESLGRIAEYFGVAPEAVVNWDEEAITESSPTVGMGYTPSDPMQTWTYFDGAATASLVECAADPGLADDTSDNTVADEVCVPTEDPPAGVPDAAAAEAKMADMLAVFGVAAASVEMATYADEFVASVDATELDADGVATGRTWTLGLSGGGVAYAASGPLAVPQRVGPYPLVGLDVATSRLAGGWAGGGVFSGNDATIDNPDAGPDDKRLPVEPGDVPTPPEPDPVSIVAVQPDRVWLWDANNDAWMVPGYRFLDANQNRWSVPAIDDELLNAPGANGSSAVQPDATDAVQGPSTSSATDAVPASTLAPDALEALNGLLGTASLAEFTTAAASFGITVRVSTIDGEGQTLTEDLQPNRVNVSIDSATTGNLDDSVVAAIDFIG